MSDSHYFDPQPLVGSQRTAFEVILPDVSFPISGDRGVFSQRRLDTGTKLLLLEAPTPPATGNLLDLGCGAGPIAITLAKRSPGATVWAVDVNERAVDLTARNAAAAGCGTVRAALPGSVPEDVRFDVVWSNPPIRIGKPALHELLLFWLARLTDDGYAVLVVQQHLGADSLAAWLATLGWSVQRLRSRAGYRLLRVSAAQQTY